MQCRILYWTLKHKKDISGERSIFYFRGKKTFYVKSMIVNIFNFLAIWYLLQQLIFTQLCPYKHMKAVTE